MDAMLDLKAKTLVFRKINFSVNLLQSSAGHLLLPSANTSMERPMGALVMQPDGNSWPVRAICDRQYWVAGDVSQGGVGKCVNMTLIKIAFPRLKSVSEPDQKLRLSRVKK